MGRIRVVEDDRDQRELRGMLLEAKGHTLVETDEDAEIVLMDLRIPTMADGLARIRALKSSAATAKVVVLSGAVSELRGQPEEKMVDAILEKPCPSGKLFRTIQTLLMLLIAFTAFAQPKDLKRHAPVLYQRADTVGTESDIPLLMYVEWDQAEKSLTYTVIFSNEDGGTSTRDLMARWGRATDIEYVYKVWLAADGSALKRQIQAKDHKDIPFEGPFEGDRPLLVPVTRNNMVAGAAEKTGRRFDMAPLLVDLSEHSREYVMDLHPETWKVMGEELKREGKLRAYGEVRGEDISDPANYAYVEFRSTQKAGGRVAVGFTLPGGKKVQMSHLGKAGNTVERSGWMRLATELPPGTKLADLGTVVFACYGKGSCLVDKVAFVELKGERKGVEFATPAEIPAGEIWLSRLK
jgi:CheY-like chemotaxis protein